MFVEDMRGNLVRKQTLALYDCNEISSYIHRTEIKIFYALNTNEKHFFFYL